MKKKYLIVIADYYKDITKGLLANSLNLIPKSNTIKIILKGGIEDLKIFNSHTFVHSFFN